MKMLVNIVKVKHKNDLKITSLVLIKDYEFDENKKIWCFI